MILATAALLLQTAAQAAGQVDIVTAATDIVVVGVEGARSVSAESRGVPRPAVTVTGGVTRIRDTNQSLRRVEGTYRIAIPSSARVSVRVRCIVEPDMPCPNAKVLIENVAAAVYQGVDGNAVISNISGDVSAESLYGTVTIRNAAGRVSASSQTNAIRVAGARGASTIRSVTGMIYLESLLGGADVTNTTGEIRMSGEVGSSARYELSTDIGQIRIALAKGADATIEVNAQPDAVRVFDREARVSRLDSRRRTVVVGKGSAKISAKTLSGGVDIRTQR